MKNVAKSFAQVMNDAVVRRLAGGQPYEQGCNCFRDGRVESLDLDAGGLRAIVRDSYGYKVTLSAGEATR